jgi:hypothetical protein
MTSKKTYTRPDTILAVAGRDPDNNFGIVNPPVYHASTILSPTMAKFENRVPFEGFGYGRNGTPTQKALEDAVAAIEGAHRSIAVQSGPRGRHRRDRGLPQDRRPHAGDRQRLRSGAPLLQHHAEGISVSRRRSSIR